jgi:hypothetical protein
VVVEEVLEKRHLLQIETVVLEYQQLFPAHLPFMQVAEVVVLEVPVGLAAVVPEHLQQHLPLELLTLAVAVAEEHGILAAQLVQQAAPV